MQSILNDVRNTFQFGNMVMKLIIINVAVFVVLSLVKAFSVGLGFDFNQLLSWIAIPNTGLTLLTRPWTLLTHMFTHVGFFHTLMNMFYLYWFGRIVGDLIGDKHILPVYILGGLAGAIFFVVVSNIFALANLSLSPLGSIAYGASAAVAALVILSGMIAPDYEINLILIGRVRLKYIVAVIIFFYILGIFGTNSGGNIGHLGGVLFGLFYYNQMGKGVDLTKWFSRFTDAKSVVKSEKYQSPLKVSYKKDTVASKNEMTVDSILEKIQKVGVEGLTKKERDFLDQESRK